MARIKQAIKYPEGWLGSNDGQKEQWAREADLALAEQGRVRPNSLQSFAIAWEYERQTRAASRRNPVTEESEDEVQDNPAESAG